MLQFIANVILLVYLVILPLLQFTVLWTLHLVYGQMLQLGLLQDISSIYSTGSTIHNINQVTFDKVGKYCFHVSIF